MPIQEITDSFSLDRIVPFFQPIMDLNADRVWRYECLARLINEQEHTFLPNEFLFLVERNNWVHKLTETMLVQSAHYFRHVNMPWNINLSTQDLLNPELLRFFNDLISEYPNKQRVSVEVTAHAVSHYPDAFNHFIDTCNASGIGIFVDNLGHVPININNLMTLPITGVKLSGSLIHQYNQDAAVQDYVNHICETANQNNVNVIAEHVEETQTLETLKTLSIPYAQGYLFSRPRASITTH